MNPILQELLTWTSTGLCVTQSAFFSGLNLAIFSVSKLRLEVEAASGNLDAIRVLDLRKDSNFTLCTIVWGNAVTNVLLTLLSDSVLAGLGAFVFSTFAITVFGDIVPQAYFSRNALQMAARLRPLDLEVYCHRPVIVSDMSAVGRRNRTYEVQTKTRCHRERPDSDVGKAEAHYHGI